MAAGEAAQSVESLIQSKLASLQNFQANYIKLSMRRHVLCCLENSPLAARQAKRPAFAINYISLLGYKLTESTAVLAKRTQNFIASEQKKTALEVLSKICSGNFTSVLRVISNQKQTIDKIKSQFDLLASLVSIKSSLIEPTFIAIARYNKEMGDWMIRKFLSSPNFEKHAQLTGNLVMCEKSEVPNRLQMLQDHLMSCFKERPGSAEVVPELLPAIQVFVQSVRLSAPSLTAHKRIDLAVDSAALLGIIDMTSALAAEGSESQTRLLRQFVVLLLCPPAPFVNSLAHPVAFSGELLAGQPEEDSGKTRQRQLLASVLAASISEIAHGILDRGLLLKELTEPLPRDPASGRLGELEHALTFWAGASQDLTVRKRLQDQRLPFVLYKLLRSESIGDSAEGSESMLAALPAQVVTGIVDLVRTLVAGHAVLEGELADLLIEDLEHLSRQRDMDFVNKVFLPLIKVERALPVTLGPARSSESGQPALLAGMSSLVEASEAAVPGSSSFLATELL